MPQSKKKTAAKTGKAGSPGAKKASPAKLASGSKSSSSSRKPATGKKSSLVKKVASKKASSKSKTAARGKIVSTSRSAGKKPAAKAAEVKSGAGKSQASSKPAAQKTQKARQLEKTDTTVEAVQTKAIINDREGTDSKKKSVPMAISQEARAEAVPKSPNSARKTSRKKSQDSELADSIHQGLANKQGQKKRGWRDIEALTERARLKSLLSDIWHEDIDLDSDIFGETDQFSSYYTDKEEEIEVEDDEDEEWEEFEEDES